MYRYSKFPCAVYRTIKFDHYTACIRRCGASAEFRLHGNTRIVPELRLKRCVFTRKTAYSKTITTNNKRLITLRRRSNALRCVALRCGHASAANSSRDARARCNSFKLLSLTMAARTPVKRVDVYIYAYKFHSEKRFRRKRHRDVSYTLASCRGAHVLLYNITT